jgi:hypothetical protein
MIVSENRQLDCYLHRLHPRYDLLFLFDVSPVSCDDIPQRVVVLSLSLSLSLSSPLCQSASCCQ